MQLGQKKKPRIWKKYRFIAKGTWIKAVVKPCRCGKVGHLRTSGVQVKDGKKKVTGIPSRLKESAAYPSFPWSCNFSCMAEKRRGQGWEKCGSFKEDKAGHKFKEGYEGCKAKEGYKGSKAKEGCKGCKAKEGYKGCKAKDGCKGCKAKEGGKGCKAKEGGKGCKAKEGCKGCKAKEGEEKPTQGRPQFTMSPVPRKAKSQKSSSLRPNPSPLHQHHLGWIQALVMMWNVHSQSRQHLHGWHPVWAVLKALLQSDLTGLMQTEPRQAPGWTQHLVRKIDGFAQSSSALRKSAWSCFAGATVKGCTLCFAWCSFIMSGKHKFSRHDKYFQTAPSVFQTSAQNVKAYVFHVGIWKLKL